MALQHAQPLELVRHVGVVQAAAVGHVEGPDPHAVARGGDRARLLGGFLAGFAERGLTGERALHVLEPHAGRDGDAVPLIQAVHLDVVAGLLEGRIRELLRLALHLLHREHVDVFTDGELDGAGDAGSDRVDVPGGQAHASSLVARFDPTLPLAI